MVKERNHGITMKFFLWSAFYINIAIFIISVILKFQVLIVLSLVVSLFLLMIHKRHRLYYATSGMMPDNYESPQSFFQYLQNIFRNSEGNYSLDDNSGVVRTSVQFSPNPDFSKGEAVLHSRKPVEVDKTDFNVWVGSIDCEKPSPVGLLNIDIPDFPLLNSDLISGLDQASDTGQFIFSVQDFELSKWKDGNLFLKLPINIHSPVCNSETLEALFKRLSAYPPVKGIEIVYDTIFSSCHSLSEMMDEKNNCHFNDYTSLLEFVQKIRSLSKGRPVGIRTGIGATGEFTELCKAMKNTGTALDFITIFGTERSVLDFSAAASIKDMHGKMPLETAVSFASREIKNYKLDKEVKIFAAGAVTNGFELLKLIALGANACISIKSAKVFNQMSDDYFYNDSELVVKSNTLHLHRSILREAVQIMEYAGFSSIEKIDPGMFFRKINHNTIKSLEEIYFKNNQPVSRNIFENFIHLN